MGKIQDWADSADRESKARHAKDQNDVPFRTESGEKSTQEKDTIAPVGSYPSTFESGGTMDQTDPEKLVPKQSLSGASNATSANISDAPAVTAFAGGTAQPTTTHSSSQRRRRRTGTRSSRREFHASDDIIDMGDAEELMKLTQGHLVVWPHEWLAKEEQGGNWLYSIDQLAPLEI